MFEAIGKEVLPKHVAIEGIAIRQPEAAVRRRRNSAGRGRTAIVVVSRAYLAAAQLLPSAEFFTPLMEMMRV